MYVWHGQFVSFMLCERLGGLLFSLGNFHFVTCNAYKILMKGSCNLLAYVKVTKNVEGLSCQIIANDFFCNLSKFKWIRQAF